MWLYIMNYGHGSTVAQLPAWACSCQQHYAYFCWYVYTFAPDCCDAVATSFFTADIACKCSYLFCEHSCAFGSLDPRCCPSTFLKKCRRVILQSECESCVQSFSLKYFFNEIVFPMVQNLRKFCAIQYQLLNKQKFPPPSPPPSHIHTLTHTHL